MMPAITTAALNPDTQNRLHGLFTIFLNISCRLTTEHDIIHLSYSDIRAFIRSSEHSSLLPLYFAILYSVCLDWFTQI